MSEPTRTTLHTVFVTPGEARLRAGWRLVLQGLLMLALLLIFSVPLLFVMVAAPDLVVPGSMLATGAASVASVLLARRLVDRRSIVSLGLKWGRQAWQDVLAGIAVTLVQVGFIFGLLAALGWLRVTGAAWQDGMALRAVFYLVGWLGLFVLVGFYEELLSRGYQLQNLEAGTNTFWAVVLSSALFGFLHITNSNASAVSTLGIILAGFFLAYPYLRTRQLWFSVGVHIGWNFFLGPVFGFPVSGIDTFRLLDVEVTGPALWTGGVFGPEAGLIVLPALGLGALLVWALTRGRLPIAE
jgi:membrane protease YdiL (CAAX protease family)